jgi:uridine kinase
LVVVAGGTASGKSTAARTAAARIPGSVLIAHDRYYHDIPEPRGHNFDHPEALDTALLVDHLRALRAGQRAPLPVYDFAAHARTDTVEWVEPAPVVVVEGILTLAYGPLAELADLRIYVDTPDDVRLVRRIRRDIRERGRTVESVLDQYLATVRPMHERFVAPSRERADVVLCGGAPMELVAGAMERAILRSMDRPD